MVSNPVFPVAIFLSETEVVRSAGGSGFEGTVCGPVG